MEKRNLIFQRIKAALPALAIVLAGCGNPATVDTDILSTAVENAFVVRYSELTGKEANSVGSYARFYGENENWREGTEFDPEEAYYVRARLDRRKVAIVNSMYSCGSEEQCDQDELDEKVSKSLAETNAFALYGKYQNKWGFMTSSGPIPGTWKNSGHKLINITRSADGKSDVILVGPLPEQPVALEIRPNHDWNSSYYIQFSL